MTDPASLHRALALGADHLQYGEFEIGALSQDTVWGISVGADRDSPSLAAKGDRERPNEDGLLVLESAEGTLLAVADAHYGREASHELLTRLDAAMETLPESLAELEAHLTRLSETAAVESYASNTSLVLAVVQRATRQGFGLSFGDSSFAILGANGYREPLDTRIAPFVSPARPRSLRPYHADPFTFRAEPGELLLAFTDGIDECHYGNPATSVTPRHMEKLWQSAEGDVRGFVTRLIETALAGVDGNPGGQDNIAVVASRV